MGQRPGPKPAPDRRGPAPLRGLRKLRPLEVSRQPPDLLPGVRHHCLVRTDTGKRQTRQPSARRRRPGTGRAEGQDTRASVKSRAEAWRSRSAPSAGRGLREEVANRVKAGLKADSVFIQRVGCQFRSSNHQMIVSPCRGDETHFFCRDVTNRDQSTLNNESDFYLGQE